MDLLDVSISELFGKDEDITDDQCSPCVLSPSSFESHCTSRMNSPQQTSISESTLSLRNLSTRKGLRFCDPDDVKCKQQKQTDRSRAEKRKSNPGCQRQTYLITYSHECIEMWKLTNVCQNIFYSIWCDGSDQYGQCGECDVSEGVCSEEKHQGGIHYHLEGRLELEKMQVYWAL